MKAYPSSIGRARRPPSSVVPLLPDRLSHLLSLQRSHTDALVIDGPAPAHIYVRANGCATGHGGLPPNGLFHPSGGSNHLVDGYIQSLSRPGRQSRALSATTSATANFKPRMYERGTATAAPGTYTEACTHNVTSVAWGVPCGRLVRTGAEVLRPGRAYRGKLIEFSEMFVRSHHRHNSPESPNGS